MSNIDNTFGLRTLIKSLLRAFNLNRGIIPTLKDLLVRPHIVSNHYIEGKRERYISPAQLFIVAVSLVALVNIFSNEQEIDNDPLELIELTENKQILRPIVPIINIMNKSPFSYLFFLIIPFAIVTRLLSYKSEITFAMHIVNHMYNVFFIAILSILIDNSIGNFLNEHTGYIVNMIMFSIVFLSICYYTFSLKKFLKNSFLLSFLKVIIMLLSCAIIYFTIVVQITPDISFKNFDFIKIFKDVGVFIFIPILLVLIQKIIIFIKHKLK
jgi:hypothetical protein